MNNVKLYCRMGNHRTLPSERSIKPNVALSKFKEHNLAGLEVNDRTTV